MNFFITFCKGEFMNIFQFLVISILLTFGHNLFSEATTVKSVPNPRINYGGFISDPDKFLSENELTSLNADLLSLETQTSAEFAIVILSSIGESSPKDFAVELFNHWGIGKKGKDNGLLLLLVMDQRRWEFETGYGLEGVLPDAILKRIGEDKLVPKLRQKKMGEGFSEVISEVSKKIKNEPDIVGESNQLESIPANDYLPTEPSSNNSGFIYYLFSFYFAPMYAIVFYLGIFYLKNREGKKHSLLFSESLINWKLVSIGIIPYILYSIFLAIEGYLYLPPIFMAVYFFLGIFITVSIFQIFYQISKKVYEDPYEFYKAIDLKFRSWEFITLAILFPLPLILLVIWGFIKKRKLRLEVRVCQKCNIPMVRLDEDKDDFFLKDGQKIEEKIGSIDYDVWFCEKSKDVKIYAYEALFTSYSKCPSCRYKTYFVASDTVTVSPTCTSSGSGIRRYACKNCSYKTSSTYTIPARDCSKSSSSSGSSYRSSSSSSSSSSFGGGRSGGGGAGGSW